MLVALVGKKNKNKTKKKKKASENPGDQMAYVQSSIWSPSENKLPIREENIHRNSKTAK